jgi:hypothetical protein
MDNQQLFNLVVSVAGFLAIFVFYQTIQRLQKLEDSLSALEKQLPHDYVTKDDYRADIKEVKDILGKIFDKLDGKADKS